MSAYILEVTHTPAAWANLIQKTQDGLAFAARILDYFEGFLLRGGLTAGEYDTTVFMEVPDHVNAQDLVLAIGGSGIIKTAAVTPLYSMSQEGIAAMAKANAEER